MLVCTLQGRHVLSCLHFDQHLQIRWSISGVVFLHISHDPFVAICFSFFKSIDNFCHCFTYKPYKYAFTFHNKLFICLISVAAKNGFDQFFAELGGEILAGNDRVETFMNKILKSIIAKMASYIISKLLCHSE